MFDVRPTGPYRLKRAPLAQALAQVRFPVQASLGTFEGIAIVQKELSRRYPYLDQQKVQGIEVQFTPEGTQAAEMPSEVNWSFADDEGHQVIVTPASATLSAGSGYQGVSDFSARFAEILTILRDKMHIPRCDRLGVRYLTVAGTSDDEHTWRGWFRPELLGWVGTSILDESTTLTSAIHQVQFTAEPLDELARLPSRVQAVIRHGFVPAGSAVPGVPPITIRSSSYLLDLDLFILTPQHFDPESIKEQFQTLHGQIDRFFRWSLTPAGEQYFGLEEG